VVSQYLDIAGVLSKMRKVWVKYAELCRGLSVASEE
jgi:hypothetical protein